MNSPIADLFRTATQREQILYSIFPEDEDEAEKYLIRALSDFEPMEGGSCASIPVRCASGYLMLRLIVEDRPNGNAATGVGKAQSYFVPRRIGPLRVLAEELERLPEIVLVEHGKIGSAISAGVVCAKTRRLIQSWSTIFEKKFDDCPAPDVMVDRLVRRMVRLAARVALGKISEDTALRCMLVQKLRAAA